MNEQQLYSLRSDPPPEFAARLRSTLPAHDVSAAEERHAWPLAKIAAGIAVIAVVAGLFAVPAVRASAESFLALFRVVNFVAVPVDESRLTMLKSRQLDPPHLLGDRIQILKEAGAPTPVASPEQAGSLAGIDVRLPEYLPPAMTIKEITVTGEYVAQVTADAARLQEVMDAVGIDDLTVPEGLDGQVSTIRVPPVVTVKYEQGPRVTRLYQARTPQVSMPSPVDLASLGEIGLRILGLPRRDAKQFAHAMTWQTTLLVPVPPTISSFKQVDIKGHGGVALERWVPSPAATPRTRVNVLLWAADGRVFGLESTQQTEDLLLMANSVR